MSEAPAPGWWQAPDGGWHPPPAPADDTAPDGPIAGSAQATPEPEQSTGTGTGRRWIILAGVVAVLVAVVVGVAVAQGGESKESAYLENLKSTGNRSDFSTDRQAVVFADRTCADLDEGGDATGTAAALIAVKHYCPDYQEGFVVLEVQAVNGTFTLIDSDSASAGCRGEGGYGDISSSTPVVLRNSDGDELGRTSLGNARKDLVSCVFNWEIDDISEGEKTYILEVGDRGEISYSWSELKAGPEVSLG